jgi:hypothetical protein
MQLLPEPEPSAALSMGHIQPATFVPGHWFLSGLRKKGAGTQGGVLSVITPRCASLGWECPNLLGESNLTPGNLWLSLALGSWAILIGSLATFLI